MRMTAKEADMELAFPKMRYDHTMPLLEGRVEIPGVRINPVSTPAMVVDDLPELRTGDFGLCDFNAGYWPSAIEAGWELIGLPLFIKRKPVYQYLFVRTDRGIESPKDLEGKKIGTNFYPTGITILTQGLLQHRHGVDTSKLTWVANGKSTVFPIHTNIPKVEIAEGERKSPWARLLDGEVDGIISDISDGQAWADLEGSSKVKRLFDYVEEDRKLYEETGVFTPMHLIVISKKLDRENPGLARKVFDAFVEAKSLAYQDIHNDRGGLSVVYLREHLVEQTRQWGDPMKYGVKDDLANIKSFLRYNYEQGMTSRLWGVEEVFAASTLET
jgi:4,5-dihydroxyphthalate decarboxylase